MRTPRLRIPGLPVLVSAEPGCTDRLHRWRLALECPHGRGEIHWNSEDWEETGPPSSRAVAILYAAHRGALPAAPLAPPSVGCACTDAVPWRSPDDADPTLWEGRQ